MLVLGSGVLAKRAAALVAPSIADFISSNFGEATTDPATFATSGLTYNVGEILIGFGGSHGGVNLVDINGDTDDTGSITVSVVHSVGSGEANIGLGTISVVSTLDTNMVFNKSGGRRMSGGLVTIAGSSGLDGNASNNATNEGAGDVSKPICAAFTVDSAKCLILAIALSRGSHFTNPPVAPSGYTLLFSQTAAGDAPDGTSSCPTLALAYKVQDAAGAVAAATFLGLEDADTSTHRWVTIHRAYKP